LFKLRIIVGWWMNNQSRQALWLALAGSIVLMIGMGYGRFAFTGVLPLMLNEGLLTLHEGNLAASANYAGYLVGALLLARAAWGRRRLSIISAGLTIASLALLAWVSSPWTITLRAVAGALSAITLIAGSLWLLEHMGHHHGAPLLYAGVGLGIFISAEDRPWTCPEPHQPADLAALRIMRRSAAGAGDPLAADSAGCTGAGFPC
jgi:MFS family permease